MTKYTCDYKVDHIIKDEPWVEYCTQMKGDKVVKIYGFRIVCKEHLQGRGYRETVKDPSIIVSDCPVETFLDKAVAVEMFDKIATGKCDLKSAMKVYKRLYIPGYEEARIKLLELYENWHFGKDV